MEFIQLKSISQVLRRKRNVYLDYNATTPVSKYVRKRMSYVLKNVYGNPSSVYTTAHKASQLIEEARQKVATAIGAQSEEITFTSCATEANNHILKSLSRHFASTKRTIVASPIEHPSVMETLSYLETQGTKVKYCPVDHQGRISPEEMGALIDEDTFLVCCMLANNELGTIQDIHSISKLAHSKGAYMMSDCVQALGKIPVNLEELGVDYASFSAHKLHGPKGIGALYVKTGNLILPLIHGGHQEEGRRAGTESVHNIVGFGAACEQIDRLLKSTKHLHDLKDELLKNLQKSHPEMVVNTPDDSCLPNTLNLTFPGINNAALVAMLDFQGIAVSAGSACSMPDNKPSHVLQAIGMSEEQAQESIRISLGTETTLRDIRYTAGIFARYANQHELSVKMITPNQLNQEALEDEGNYILDVRPASMRKKYRGLAHSHAISFFSLGRYLKELPQNKQIIVACQHGNLSYAATYYLQAKGFTNANSLWRGISGWQETHGVVRN